MRTDKHFKFPKEILHQIHECSAGFFLVIINDKGEFERYFHADSQVAELGLVNYLDIKSQELQEATRATGVKENGNEEEQEA